MADIELVIKIPKEMYDWINIGFVTLTIICIVLAREIDKLRQRVTKLEDKIRGVEKGNEDC